MAFLLSLLCKSVSFKQDSLLAGDIWQTLPLTANLHSWGEHNGPEGRNLLMKSTPVCQAFYHLLRRGYSPNSEHWAEVDGENGECYRGLPANATRPRTSQALPASLGTRCFGNRHYIGRFNRVFLFVLIWSLLPASCDSLKAGTNFCEHVKAPCSSSRVCSRSCRP